MRAANTLGGGDAAPGSLRARQAAVAAAVCLAASLLVAGARHAARADAPTLTRIRVLLSTTSDWARLGLPGATLLAVHASGAAPGAHVSYGASSVTLTGPAPSSATVDAVVLVPLHVSPVLKLDKGYEGDAAAVVERTTAGVVTIAHVTDEVRSGRGPYEAVATVDRSALVDQGFVPARVDPRRLVLAFYYPWWTSSSFRSGYWADRPAYDPATDSAPAVANQMAMAVEHGINGFVVSWDGAGPHPGRFDLVLSAAAHRGGFSVAPYLEVDEIHQHQGEGPGPVLQQLRAALSRASNQAFLHVGSRPVVFVFEARNVSASDWAAIRRALTAAGQDPFLVADDPFAQSSFDGFHYYNPNLMTPSKLTETYLASLASVRLIADVDPSQTRRLWAAAVSPGEDSRAENFWRPTVRSRHSGSTYAQTWQAALTSLPDWVLVTSWNEWFEDTAVAPGRQSGSTALTETGSWSAQFHRTP